MIAVHLLHSARTLARIGRLAWDPFRPRLKAAGRAVGSLEGVDRRTLSDIGIGRGAIVSLPGRIGLDQLRRPPHV